MPRKRMKRFGEQDRVARSIAKVIQSDWFRDGDVFVLGRRFQTSGDLVPEDSELVAH